MLKYKLSQTSRPKILPKIAEQNFARIIAFQNKYF
jgi:hypothetical protein